MAAMTSIFRAKFENIISYMLILEFYYGGSCIGLLRPGTAVSQVFKAETAAVQRAHRVWYKKSSRKIERLRNGRARRGGLESPELWVILGSRWHELQLHEGK